MDLPAAYKSDRRGVYQIGSMRPIADESGGWCRELYASSAAKLLLYGRALGLTHSEAEDILHDTFAALLTRAAPPDDPPAYVTRSFRNRVLNHRRGLWRRLLRELESRRWFERQPDESTGERRAMAALAGLPVEQREVIVLKIWHSLTCEEIGKLLELSPNTVAGRYRYGVRKLRTALKGEPDESLGTDPLVILETPPAVPGN